MDRWTTAPCDNCGMEFQATRAEPRPDDGPVICPECAAYDKGYSDGAAALDAEMERADGLAIEHEYMAQRLLEAQGQRDAAIERAERAEAKAAHFMREYDVARGQCLDALILAEAAESRIAKALSILEPIKDAWSGLWAQVDGAIAALKGES